jgi:hypothetical protein
MTFQELKNKNSVKFRLSSEGICAAITLILHFFNPLQKYQ